MPEHLSFSKLADLDNAVEHILRAARVPGAAIAIATKDGTRYAKGFGHRDLASRTPMAGTTSYPIASTTKALNATLIGILVDEGVLAWDRPVQVYLPTFRLGDARTSATITLRDLLAMRTGLPRHDWAWLGYDCSRAELVRRMQFLDLSAGFREKFQYNNLTATAAGYIAEVVTGRSWNDLIKARILEPLGMDSTTFGASAANDVTRSYLENEQRALILTDNLIGDVTAPSGGSIHSSVEDMARWISFNLNRGKQHGHQLIQAETLNELHLPQVVARTDPASPSPFATYGLGWFIDTFHGYLRVAHGGYFNNVNSEVMLLPKADLGVVAFSNFGPPGVARLLCQIAFETLAGLEPEQTIEAKLGQYEERIRSTSRSKSVIRRVPGTTPRYPLNNYVGTYSNQGYGTVEIILVENALTLLRGQLALTLEHWHFDIWVARDVERFAIHAPHPLDRNYPISFELDTQGRVVSLTIPFEPDTRPIQFWRKD